MIFNDAINSYDVVAKTFKNIYLDFGL
jgi:hypothetical protein